MTVLEELEQIDDDCDKHGIQFVKIDDARTADEFGIDSVGHTIPPHTIPYHYQCLMYFFPVPFRSINRFRQLFISKNKFQTFMMVI